MRFSHFYGLPSLGSDEVETGGRVGIRKTVTAPMPPRTNKLICIHGWPEKLQIDKAIITDIDPIATHLVRRVRLRCSSQLRNIGPINLCRNIHRCTRGDAFAKQAAANKTKGVVGKPGRKMPIMPSSNAKPPTSP